MSVAALVLAAGTSTRAGARNKLLAGHAGGRTMIAQVVDTALASKAGAVLVVVGHEAGQVMAALAGRAVTFVHASDFRAGLSASLRAGLAAVPDRHDAVLVCLGDMPLVTACHLDRIIAHHDRAAGHLIVVPAHRGARGNPVLWDRRFFPDMMAVTGDTGARALLVRHAAYVLEAEFGSDAILRDFDTADALARLP